MKRGRVLGIALLATAIVVASSQLFARLAVGHDAAGALLSPAGLDDPMAWLLAGAYALTRVGGAALICVTVALAAALGVASLIERSQR